MDIWQEKYVRCVWQVNGHSGYEIIKLFGDSSEILLISRMDKNDQKYFPCDIRKFDWAEYRINYHLGLILYVGQEELNNFDAARKKYRIMAFCHSCVCIFYYAFFIMLYYFLGNILGVNDYLMNLYLSLKTGIGFGGKS